MNRLFYDQNQNVFVKVMSNEEKVERELTGAKVFSKFTNVAQITILDSKVILVSKVVGTVANTATLQLSTKIIELLLSINSQFSGQTFPKFSIDTQIDDLEFKLGFSNELVELLSLIRQAISGRPIFPVHGDLQAQNLFVSDSGKLTLIDFEHFCFAPQELELVNSLFHQDSNCLDVKEIIPILIARNVISPHVLSWLLVFYTIKEISQGLSLSLAGNKLAAGQSLLSQITGKKINFFPKPWNLANVNPTSVSSCFVWVNNKNVLVN